MATVHGDLGQGQRERALRAFRTGKVDVLTATEVAARGLDVDDVTHVVNYECPDDEMTYVHRIGRTGRAGRAGVAVTFVDWRDMHRWKLINDALGLGMAEPEETYSTSEHLYTQLDIPPEATGTLPRAMRERAGLDAEAIEDIGETGKIRSPRSRRGSAGGDSAGRGSGRGAGRGGSGQARKSARDTGDGSAKAGGEATRTRRRRRTRAGRELGAEQPARESGAGPAREPGQQPGGESTARSRLPGSGVGGGRPPAAKTSRRKPAARPPDQGFLREFGSIVEPTQRFCSPSPGRVRHCEHTSLPRSA